MLTKKSRQFVEAIYTETFSRKPSEQEFDKATSILSDPAAYLSRYIRSGKTAILSCAPARGTDGKLLEDAPPIYSWKVSQGTPYAVMVAFKDDDKLHIGWAKRNVEKALLWDDNFTILHAAKTLEAVAFFKAVEKFMKAAQMKDKEISFDKEVGKYFAVLRALSEKLEVGKRSISSSVVGHVPRDLVAPMIRFIANMEKIFGAKAANVEKI